MPSAFQDIKFLGEAQLGCKIITANIIISFYMEKCGEPFYTYLILVEISSQLPCIYPKNVQMIHIRILLDWCLHKLLEHILTKVVWHLLGELENKLNDLGASVVSHWLFPTMTNTLILEPHVSKIPTKSVWTSFCWFKAVASAILVIFTHVQKDS